jgi:LysR family transcriptional regulator, hydrogen peroxide-inducible genes activator
MQNFTLRQLQYFDAVARLGQFGLAAGACAISQPALSMQIKELEAHLGHQLFERGARQVRLTAFGERLMPIAQEVLRGADRLAETARAMQGGLPGQLRLGVIPTVAPYLLPAVIGRLAAAYPAVDLQVRETVTQRLIAELGDGRLDAAIVALPVSEPSLQEVPLFDEDFVLVRQAKDAEQPVPSRENLRAFRLLLLEEGHCFRDQALSFCKAGGAAPREIMEGSSLSTLVQMVGAGIGVTLIPEMAIGVETRSAPVAVARFAGTQPQRRVGMVWRKSSGLARELQRVAEVVKGAALVSKEGPNPDPLP